MNKNIIKGNLLLIGSGVILSSILYGINYLIFRDIPQTISSIILSLAYVPIGVVYQMFIMNIIIEKRESLALERKTNVIIGSFYHEVGLDIIKLMIKGDKTIEEIKEYLIVIKDWKDSDFDMVKNKISNYQCDLDLDKIEISKIYEILEVRDDFILGLITNSLFSNNDEFNELLISLLHLRDEFQIKNKNSKKNNYEIHHLKKDLITSYKYLIIEWINFVKKLKNQHPFLYQKALKNSPFENMVDE